MSVEARRAAGRRAAFRFMLPLRYLLAGTLLGAGAPLGLLLVRLAEGHAVAEEWAAHRTFYVYDLVGTCLVFAVAGLLAGRFAERLRRGRDRFHDLAEHDELTGMLNVRAYNSFYRRATAHASRYREPLSLLVIDVDQLKSINDEFGHLAGNTVLRHVADCIRSAKRVEDTAARWGGDEFVLLLRSGDRDAAERVAREILDQVRGVEVPLQGQRRRVTVTIGGATWTSGADGVDLYAEADRALLAAKRGGGDRYLAAVGSPPP